MRRDRLPLVISVALVLLTLGAYARVWGNDFVDYDDGDYVTRNPDVQSGLSGNSFWWALTTTHADNWHPLTWLSLQLDYEVFGSRPWGYHGVNLLLHAANTVLLFLVLRQMTSATWTSAFTAALFAVHPLHVESVAWVSERKDVLSTLFWILTLWAYTLYVRRPRPGRYLLVALLFLFGLMAKPMLVTLPFVLLLLDYWPLGRLRFGNDHATSHEIAGNARHTLAPAAWWRLLAEKLPLLILSVVVCLITLLAQQTPLQSLTDLSLRARIENALVAYAAYLVRTCWPISLSVYYPHAGEGQAPWEVAGACLLLAVITAGALWQARRRPYLILGWLWYVGTLVPVIGLVQVGEQAFADRYTYVPLIGIFILVSWSAADIMAHWRLRAVVPAGAAALVLAGCTVATYRQTAHWHDGIALWQHAVEVNPENAFAHDCLGSAYMTRGMVQEAMPRFERAVELLPNKPLFHFHLMLALRKLGQVDAANQELQRVVTPPADAGKGR